MIFKCNNTLNFACFCYNSLTCSEEIMILALALFIVMYIFLLALPEKRPYIALIAAGIFILLGILPLGNIIGAVDWNIILNACTYGRRTIKSCS